MIESKLKVKNAVLDMYIYCTLDIYNVIWTSIWQLGTVPLKCKLQPSRETRLVSLEKFLVSREYTSTNALPSGECTNGIIEILFCAHLQCIHVGIAFVYRDRGGGGAGRAVALPLFCLV